VRFSGDGELCNHGVAPSIPCNNGRLRQAVSISQDGGLDFDLHAVKVSGTVTVNGQPMVDEPLDRGAIVFDSGGQGALAVGLGKTGPAQYAATLLRGSYDVRFSGDGELCGQGVAPSIPCNNGLLRQALSITTDGGLDLDVPAVKISGSVTLQGGAFPDLPAGRGTLRFAGVAGLGATDSGELGMSGPASYAITLLPGSYVVEYGVNATQCQLGDWPLPCTMEVLVGCGP
jgi:hypothetical protein